MNQKSIVIFLVIFIHFLLLPFGSDGRAFQENPLTKAIQLFDKEKYSEAEVIFGELLKNKPDDFMVNYFYGACRTETGHYGEDDLNYLIKASKEVNPLNIDYYFAIQYHAKNQFEKALSYYKLYKAVASTNEQEKVNLSLKMEQCANRINSFIASHTETLDGNALSVAEAAVATEVVVESTVQSKSEMNTQIENETANQLSEEKDILNEEIESDAVLIDSTNQITEAAESQVQELEEETVKETVKPIPAEEQIKFSVNNEITYLALSNFKTEEGKNFFQEASITEAELNKVMVRTEILREKYKKSQSRAERDSIGQLILSLEGESYDLKNSVTQLYMQAKNAENGYWADASAEETDNFIKELNTLSQNTTSHISNAVGVSQSPEIIIPPILIVDKEVKSDAPKDRNSGVTYKIQLGAYSRGIPNSLKPVFSKISVIRKVENYTDENGVVVYTTGNLTNYDDAVVMQKQVQQEGIKDPIIAAYFNGKRITLEQAKEIDKK